MYDKLHVEQGRRKTRSNCPGHVNFALGEVKIEVWLTNEISLITLVSDNFHFQSKTILKLKHAR